MEFNKLVFVFSKIGGIYMKLQRMATKHPVLSYFVITFAVSLTGFFIIVGFTGLPGTTAQTEKFFPISLISLLFSPVISGVFLTGFIYGKKGLRHLLSRCLSFNQSLRWYFVAIFTVPIITIVVLFFFHKFLRYMCLPYGPYKIKQCLYLPVLALE